ncbi:ribosome-binding factor A [Algimonas ampicilliniresistens]|jgi:ribosome-binding factor A|uniref:Ribosome-binding factor A n=1 Tax=Algimonas ampicilliniresistens TaxID=1298735 RepID=A0ABQ5VAJ9_9PROT|nr:30S ribosome-binding factor RbfA [Algimonas ampicilliniresistens]GLQ24009.1 ribosome-binding factor A [Algimonas ampicilliniresistens]
MARNRPPSQRQLKAGEVIRRALADIINREDLRDPALKGVSVTIAEVRAAPDLKIATVFAAPLGPDADGEAVIAGLKRCSRFLRGRLGRELDMKNTPRLVFRLDTTFEVADDMARLLAQPDVVRDLGGEEE